ncbi:MAG: 2-oxoglutarate dehydrogenase complex dihydrolipoyllysine-residue succinyltransferase [Planctomycetes bacterium]|nr:2-oxoglutarate dehydrogenase complex dihydrolipoyllysine-residue succinyltransferase [Planctomycetota bacterium]
MQVELIIPDCGESITQVTLGPWLIAEGEPVQRDQTVLEIETDKATIELPAPVGGVIRKTLKKQGETAAIGEVVGYMEESAAGAATPTNSGAAGATATAAATTIAKAPTAPPKPAAATFVMPAAQRELAQRGLSAGEVAATGPGGRLLKEDVLRTAAAPSPTSLPAAPPAFEPPAGGDRHEEIVPMTPIRKRIAERLVQSKQTMALLTTFNEIDMSNVMAMRKEFGEAFERKYGVRLGFMSFFVKAAIDALKLIPAANGEIRGDSIVYKDYYDISIAVQAQKGLVVPVIRNADRMSLAQIETVVGDFGRRAKENKIGIEELQGGTFTISNGGVFGSLMSTPIVNPPQTAILGMHAIQDRPVARDGQVVIRPMMYVALTYDHRLIDGRESVTFLKRVKECVENPSRMLLEV